MPRVEPDATGASCARTGAAVIAMPPGENGGIRCRDRDDTDDAGGDEQQRHLRLQYDGHQTGSRNHPLQPVFHPELCQPVAGVQDQSDDGGTHAIEDSRHRLQITEVHVERAQCGDDDEVRKDERPTSRPSAPETTAQIGHVDADLDRERPRKRLTDRDRFAHLFLAEPLTLGDKLALHLTDQRHRAAEAHETQAKKIGHQLRHPAVPNFRRHASPRGGPDREPRSGRGHSSLAPELSSDWPGSGQLLAIAVFSSAARMPGKLDGVVIGPEVNEDHPGLLVEHVAVNCCHLDPVLPQDADHRIDLISGHQEVACNRRLAAAGRLKVDSVRRGPSVRPEQ